MDFLKDKFNISIAIICIILFGFLYTNKINRRELIPVSDPASSRGLQAAEAVEKPEEPENKEQRATIHVHLTGAVKNPGVYELESGSRVVDALEAAGGESPDADLEKINLAKLIRDEEQIKIPRAGETVDKTEATIQNSGDADTSLININTAERRALMELPGIGEVTANAIITYREANGSFQSTDEIKKVAGIGEKTYEKIRALITAE